VDFFSYSNGELCCEDVPLSRIAQALGTPLYVYSLKTLSRHFRVFDEAFRKLPHIICYSCKANSNVAILRAFGRLGSGADIVSGGELFRALKARIPAEKIVFSGVGKTDEEIIYAIKSGILMINMESEGEMERVSRIAARMKRRVAVSVRVNPEIDPKTHPYITTGLKKNKFGVLWGTALDLYRRMAAHPWLNPVGISSHIGSQILELAPFVEAVRSLSAMITELEGIGVTIRYLDIGGGLGITYKDELPPRPEEYARVIAEELPRPQLTLILEPGRVLVGNSGVFVTSLLYLKETAGKTFYIVDGAMNDLVRPALYNAYHEILPVKEGKPGRLRKVDLVGPICESGDFLAKDRDMAEAQPGDLLAVKGAGAYGFAMSSNYNSRRRVPEVLVDGSNFHVIRQRETFRDLVRKESIPPFLEV
jgi:diaminopimelate decarboxylase